ncbi:MAG: Hsp70 family protein [Fimbriimonadia bacterium]
MESRGSISVDFGTTNTVVARWNGTHAECVELDDICIHEPTWGTPLVPSAVYFHDPERVVIGSQALSAIEMDRTIVIAPERAPYALGVKKQLLWDSSQVVATCEAQPITARHTALLFLQALMQQCLKADALPVHRGCMGGWLAKKDRPLIVHLTLTTPVECHEPYRVELSRMASRVGARRLSLLDEPVAAALGYGVDISGEPVLLVVDFGGGTLNCAVVRVGPATTEEAANRRSQLLAARGEIDFGGRTVDGWVAEYLRPRLPRGAEAEDWLRRNAELIKITLSPEDAPEELTLSPPGASALIIGRDEFRTLLAEKGLYERVDRVLSDLFDDLYRRHGVGQEAVQAVLPVGGSTLLPKVRGRLVEQFGANRVWYDSPFDAVAKGGAVFGAGATVDQIVHHDYAIRLYDEKQARPEYELLVPRGTPFPSNGPVATRYYAVAKGQREFRLPICEVGYSGRRSVPWRPRAQAHYWNPQSDAEQEAIVALNPGDVIRMPSPGRGPEARLRIEFSIDEQRHLVATIYDLHRKTYLRENERVVQLR